MWLNIGIGPKNLEIDIRWVWLKCRDPSYPQNPISYIQGDKLLGPLLKLDQNWKIKRLKGRHWRTEFEDRGQRETPANGKVD